MILVYIFLLLVAIISLYIIYNKYFNKALKRSKVRKYLKLCISAIKENLRNTLIKTEQEGINNMLITYLSDKNESNLAIIIEYLILNCKIEENKVFSPPSTIMNLLLIKIIEEQLGISRNYGFLFDRKTFKNINKKAPFVKKYCVIVKLSEDSYFTDIITTEYKLPLLYKAVFDGFQRFENLICENGKFDLKKIFLPEYAIVIFKKSKMKYNIDFREYNIVFFITILEKYHYMLYKSVALEWSSIFCKNYNLFKTYDMYAAIYTQSKLFDKGFCSFLILRKLELIIEGNEEFLILPN